VKAGGRAVGIRDVAAAAGVSVTTVSHVLNDVAYARISPETRNKVRSAAVQLGYGPNRLAQALRSRRSGMLGLVSEDIATTPHAGRIILGADDAARARGYTLMVINTSGTASPESRDADMEALLDRQVDGILFATTQHRIIEAPANLGKVPAVLVDAVSAGVGFPSVVPDECGGARTAVETLLAAGHIRIGFINNAADSPSTRERLRGFRGTLTSAGLDGAAAPVEAASSDAKGGYEAARRILEADNPPSALFCYNDRMAMGAFRAAAELGLAIPEELSVVGFDNQELIAGNLHPGLTSIALPHYEMGAWAAERLIDTVEGTSGLDRVAPEPVLLNCPLVPRGSVAGPRI
jgi:LacI family transcriptional regulator